MRYIAVVWIVWVVLALGLLSLTLYHLHLTGSTEEVRAVDGDDEPQRSLQSENLAKAGRFKHAIRILGGAEGLVTLALVALYVLDALRQL